MYRAMTDRRDWGSLQRSHQHRDPKATKLAHRWWKQMRPIKSELGPGQRDCVTASASGRARSMDM